MGRPIFNNDHCNFVNYVSRLSTGQEHLHHLWGLSGYGLDTPPSSGYPVLDRLSVWIYFSWCI